MKEKPVIENLEIEPVFNDERLLEGIVTWTSPVYVNMRFRFINDHSYEEIIKGAIAALQKLLKERIKMLNFKINDKQGVELTFDGEDRKLAEQNAGNGATAQDVALGAVVVQALKLMNYKPRMELINNLIKAKERKDK